MAAPEIRVVDGVAERVEVEKDRLELEADGLKNKHDQRGRGLGPCGVDLHHRAWWQLVDMEKSGKPVCGKSSEKVMVTIGAELTPLS